MKKTKLNYAKGAGYQHEKTEVLEELLKTAVGAWKIELETILAQRYKKDKKREAAMEYAGFTRTPIKDRAESNLAQDKVELSELSPLDRIQAITDSLLRAQRELEEEE